MNQEQEHEKALGHLRKQMLLFENTMAEPEEQLQQAQQPTPYETAGTHTTFATAELPC